LKLITFPDALNLFTIPQTYGSIEAIQTEKCFHVELDSAALSAADEKTLRWILKNAQDSDTLTFASKLEATKSQVLIEVGPRFNFSTADSTNSVSICHAAHLMAVKRIEASIRYLITVNGATLTARDEVSLITSCCETC